MSDDRKEEHREKAHREMPQEQVQMPEPTSGQTDRSLLRGIRAGDDAAAEALFDRYSVRLGGLAARNLAREISGRVDAEDVTQSIFRTLFRRLRDGQYDVPPGDSIWQLLVTITLNKTRTVGAHHRAAKRDIRRSRQLEDDNVRPAAIGNEEPLRVLQMTIAELLADFSESQRSIVELRLEGHDIAAIAEKTQRSKRTVERVLQGFRAKLRATLDN